ncbi:trafac type P-loop GTPase [Cryptosporidium felis]|nr:trafac type P-loop GTPase [Cryptosporidium felis]
MESGVLSLKKEKSSVQTFIKFCPSKKKEIHENDKETQWVFSIVEHGKCLRASKKSSISKTRSCTVTGEVFKEEVCNTEIYRKAYLQNHAINTLDGISTNVIICGPHKTGKTNVLIGSQRSIGIILQSVYDIFAAIRCYSNGIHLNEKGVNTETGGNFDRLFVVKASVLEIGEDSSKYKLDDVRDLINPENPLQLIRKLGGELGYLIKGEPEHLFENEEKLVASILSAVARKKVLDAIRRERMNEKKKKKIPDIIKNTLFGDFGEKWIKDDILGSLMITITVESADKSELENNIRKNEKVANATHVNCGSIRFFEVSSCINTTKESNTIVPMFGLLDLAFELRKYSYTNEKSNRINITNISSCISSTVMDSNLIILGTFSNYPNEKKCCIRPILSPYDNQSTVQPHSIFDTLQFIDYIGNSMKFPIYPQRNCFKKPLSQSKLMEICRSNIIKGSKKINSRMVIRSERGIWQTESTGRVTRIIRLLTFINRSIEGSGVLRILMSSNEDDIIRIYCENVIGSDPTNLEGYQANNKAGNWFQNNNYRLPESELEKRKNLNYFNHKETEDKGREYFEKKKGSNRKIRFKDEKNTENNEKNDPNLKIKNLDFTIEKNPVDSLDKELIKSTSERVKLGQALIPSPDHSEFESENSEVDITNIFDSKALKNGNQEGRKNIKINLCETPDKLSNKKKFISKEIGDSDNYMYLDEGVGNSYKSRTLVSECIGSDSDAFDITKQYEKLLKKTISLNKLQKLIMENQKKMCKDESIQLDEGLDGMDIYKSQFEKNKQINYLPLVNKKAIEASQKAVEASKKAIEASKHLYKKDINHTRGKIHDFIPGSKDFPQIDIFAPSYDSDLEYDKYHDPKSIVFNKKSSDEGEKDDEDQVPIKHHYEHNEIKKGQDNCPCCQELSKRNKCRCHYADASVHFSGISETSVNTDKSLLLQYEPGAGPNEKIKLNGRSWDIFVNVPEKFADITALGFKHNYSPQDYEIENDNKSNIERDEFPIIDTIESIPEEKYIATNAKVTNDSSSEKLTNLSYEKIDKNFDIQEKKMGSNASIKLDDENKRIKKNILDDLLEIKKQTSNLRHQFTLNPGVFRPLYESNYPNNYDPFDKSNNLNYEGYKELKEINSLNSYVSPSSTESITYPVTFDQERLYSYEDALFNSNDILVEGSSDFGSFQNANYQLESNNFGTTEDKHLEDIERDINQQLINFSTLYDKERTGLHSNEYKYEEADGNNQEIRIQNVIKEVGCCHVKYILPFPKELRPKIIKGINNVKFPYLKSLY